MDKRQWLAKGSRLPFPGMKCHVEKLIGTGKNSMVYTGWYQDHHDRQQRHRVLIKELFPHTPDNSIRRLEDGTIQSMNTEAQAFFLMHRESFEAGNRIHLRLLESRPQEIGENLNTFELNGTLYTVFGYSGGRTLEEELARLEQEGELRRCVKVMISLLDALSAFHESGYLHLDISPDNVLLLGSGDRERTMLIDYNSACRIGSQDSAYLSFKEGYSAPELYEEMNDNESICEASDLYSVAAVFYRLLMGRPMTLYEAVQKEPPDAAESPLLEDAPQTVVSCVGGILRRGLLTEAEERYQNIAQMRTDFLELLDRIDCVGVTHWALWENGKRSIEELICTNPSLQYVKHEERLYPIRIETDEGCMLFEEYLVKMVSGRGGSRLILSSGGMGKTTLLMKMALAHGRRYSPQSPAMFYIPLSGWNGRDAHYICSRVLASLRYKKENNTYDGALYELEQLFGKTLRRGQAQLPVVVLLLDGLNEVRADAAPLIQEINQLSRMAGVRIMAASRSEAPALELSVDRILSLTHEDVERAAAQKGVLLPQSEALLKLIRTPLILSIFLAASEERQQLEIRDQDDLMGAYMDALQQKEIRDLPENSPLRWQIDAALNYVLPAIAARVEKEGGRLTEEQLSSVVDACYKVVSSDFLVKAFPKWIGRSSDILDGTQSAGEWHRRMVHELLWQKLGVMVRDEQGSSVFHQTIAEYLARRHRINAAAVRRKQRLKGAAFASVLLFLCAACVTVYAIWFMDKPYDRAEAEYALTRTREAYDWYMDIYEEMDSLLELAGSGSMIRLQEAEHTGWVTLYQEKGSLKRAAQLYRKRREKTAFEAQYDRVLGVILGWGMSDSGEYAQDEPSIYRGMKEQRDTARDVYLLAMQERRFVPWSGKPLDAEGLLAIFSHLWEKQAYYADVLLPQIMQWYCTTRGEFVAMDNLHLSAVQSIIRYDAQVCQVLYEMHLQEHMTSEALSEMERRANRRHDSSTIYDVKFDLVRQMSSGANTPEKLLKKAQMDAAEARGGWKRIMEMLALSQKKTLEEVIGSADERGGDSLQ